MKIKTRELEGPALDWAVANVTQGHRIMKVLPVDNYGGRHQVQVGHKPWWPSLEWSQGGPLIDQHCVAICNRTVTSNPAAICRDSRWMSGDTSLIAVCRAIVASELGDSVDVPEELLEATAERRE